MATDGGLRVVGAGLGRTGTHSLKAAFEQLLGGPCYHMLEVLGHPDHIAVWAAAVEGDEPDWGAFLCDYVATVDWPAAAYYQQLSALCPDAIVVLSTRDNPSAWWKSVYYTIFEATARPVPEGDEMGTAFRAMTHAMLRERFTPHWLDERAAIAAYEAHNAEVRATVPADRLVEWQPGDGWEPLCSALGVPVPAEPFPHLNSTEEFRMMVGLDGHDAHVPFERGT
jgi:hypothetical protein